MADRKPRANKAKAKVDETPTVENKDGGPEPEIEAPVVDVPESKNRRRPYFAV